MDNKLYIKKIIRDDGKALAFDGNEIYLAKSNTLLVRPDPETTAADYTEADGGEMIAQRNSTYEQLINGLIVPKATDYWELVKRLSGFFQINHTYKIIYVKKNGGMFATPKAWIVAGLQIIPMSQEDFSEWSISFTLGETSWTEYAEDDAGEEMYSNTVTFPLVNDLPGGEKWDEVGAEWDEIGEVWEDGSGGPRAIYVSSTKVIYPVWVVHGPCVRPMLRNDTTDAVAQFEGTVADKQTLTVDFSDGSAHLDTALVTRMISGSVALIPGENIVGFSSNGGETKYSKVSWNNIIS